MADPVPVRRLRWWPLALLVLWVATAWSMPWEPEAPAEALRRPPSDLLVVLSVSVALGLWLGPRRWLPWLPTGLLVVAAAYRAAAAAVRLAFDREFVPADLGLIDDLFYHLLHDLTPREQAVWIGVRVLALLLGIVVLRLCLGAVLRAAQRRTVAVALLLPMALVPGQLWWARSAGTSAWPVRPSALAALAAQVWPGLVVWLFPQVVDERIEFAIAQAQQALDAAPQDLARLQGVDVYVAFVESYGRAPFRQPEAGTRLRAVLREADDRLVAAGWLCATRWVQPMIYGGASWLAHMQLLCGMPVPDDRTRDRLLQSGLRPLPARLAARGWHGVSVQAAMPASWPQGQAFFGYQQELFRPQLDYRGPDPGWGPPDQYALRVLLDLVHRPERPPLFVEFVSVTAHAPFTFVPPLLDDWQAPRERWFVPPARTYAIGRMEFLRHPDVLSAYLDTTEYTLRALFGFVCQLRRPSLLLVLGDHQPPIGSVLAVPDRTRDVPLHVLANRDDLLAPFLQLGCVPGLQPPDGDEWLPTDRLAPWLLHAFGGQGR